MPPPPPVVEAPAAVQAAKSPRTSLLLGAHVGWEIPSGKIPSGKVPGDPGASFDASAVGNGGVAAALDVGVRFARQWYVGATIEHVELEGGSLSGLGTAGLNNVTSASSNTTLLGVALGLMTNPDRTSFYGEFGIGNRWYNYTTNNTKSPTYSDGEVTLAAGVWIPAGRSFRLLPKFAVSLGAFSPPSSSGNALGHAFFMLGLVGYYNANL
jgi:hypothetical protein